MKAAFCVTFLIAQLAVTAHAQNAGACDAATIKAFRTYYNENETSSVSQAIHDAACNSGTQNTGVALIGIGGFNQSEVTQACHDNNSQFFETHAKSLTFSYIPPEGLAAIEKVCGQDHLSFSATPNGVLLNVSAAWQPVGEYGTVKVESLLHTPNLKCKGRLTVRGSLIGPSGSGAICTRSDNATATIALQTDKGGYKVATFAGVDHAQYKLLIYAADDHMDCFVNETLVGGISMGSRETPLPAIELNDHFRSGTNTIMCKPQDIHSNSNGDPCWWFRYDILKDDHLIASPRGDCCGGGCPAQPPQPTPVIVMRP
jgi:hypothetical protein